jgi:hypothetical protein
VTKYVDIVPPALLTIFARDRHEGPYKFGDFMPSISGVAADDRMLHAMIVDVVLQHLAFYSTIRAKRLLRPSHVRSVRTEL